MAATRLDRILGWIEREVSDGVEALLMLLGFLLWVSIILMLGFGVLVLIGFSITSPLYSIPSVIVLFCTYLYAKRIQRKRHEAKG